MPVAGHLFWASENENKDIDQNCVAAYRFHSYEPSKTDCTVEPLKAILTKLEESKA